MIGMESDVLAGVRDDPRRGAEVGPDVLRRVLQLHLDLEVHRPVLAGAAGRSGQLGAVADLGHPADEGGVGEGVDLHGHRVAQ